MLFLITNTLTVMNKVIKNKHKTQIIRGRVGGMTKKSILLQSNVMLYSVLNIGSQKKQTNPREMLVLIYMAGELETFL